MTEGKGGGRRDAFLDGFYRFGEYPRKELSSYGGGL